MTDAPTSVELDQLEQAVGSLEQIQEFLQTHCLDYMPAISEALGRTTNIDMSGAEYQFTRQATAFGAFYSAYGMQARNDSIYRSVQQSLQEFIQHLGEAANATRTIIQNYRTTEESNTALAADIDRRLSAPIDGPSGTTFA
jgi:hypothetical protein